MVGFCCIWISKFGLSSGLLYKAQKLTDQDPLIWPGKCQKAFQTIQEKLLMTPALGLPYLRKLFDLFVHKRQGIGLGESFDPESKKY